MGPATREVSIRFRVLVDGQPLATACGSDVDARGVQPPRRAADVPVAPATGSHRRSSVRNRAFRSGAEAFVFTFGDSKKRSAVSARLRAERRPYSRAQNEVSTSVMSRTRSSSLSARSSTTRLRPLADSAASTSSTFIRPRRSLCSTTTVRTAGSASRRRSFARAPFVPDLDAQHPGSRLRCPLGKAGDLAVEIGALVVGGDPGVQTDRREFGRSTIGRGRIVHQDHAGVDLAGGHRQGPVAPPPVGRLGVGSSPSSPTWAWRPGRRWAGPSRRVSCLQSRTTYTCSLLGHTIMASSS
jgi:hypothetical protein